jgi:hypothetical protein
MEKNIGSGKIGDSIDVDMQTNRWSNGRVMLSGAFGYRFSEYFNYSISGEYQILP